MSDNMIAFIIFIVASIVGFILYDLPFIHNAKVKNWGMLLMVFGGLGFLIEFSIMMLWVMR